MCPISFGEYERKELFVGLHVFYPVFGSNRLHALAVCKVIVNFKMLRFKSSTDCLYLHVHINIFKHGHTMSDVYMLGGGGGGSGPPLVCH